MALNKGAFVILRVTLNYPVFQLKNSVDFESYPSFCITQTSNYEVKMLAIRRNDVIEEIDKKFENAIFLTHAELMDLGIFGSSDAIRKALKAGKLTFVRTSSRRCVIAKSSVLDYVKKNISISSYS
jgi:hypothetical protein